MDSGLECESLLKEVAGDGCVGGSELWIGWFAFDKHIYVCIACYLQELASSGKGGLSRFSTAQDIKVSEQTIKDKVNTQQWGRTNVLGP